MDMFHIMNLIVECHIILYIVLYHIISYHIIYHIIHHISYTTYHISFISFISCIIHIIYHISYHLFSFCRSVQDYKIHMDMERVIVCQQMSEAHIHLISFLSNDSGCKISHFAYQNMVTSQCLESVTFIENVDLSQQQAV